MGLGSRLRHAFNVFTDRKDTETPRHEYAWSSSSSGRYDSARTRPSNERSILASIYNRIGIDVASVGILHVRLDENKRFKEEIPSLLNKCLTVEANIDQGARAFKQDIVMSMLERGSIAIVPVETTLNPDTTGGYDIKNMRVGTVTQWYPKHVEVDLYDERDGKHKKVILPKQTTGLVENPFFAVMNEHNSTLQRLINKLHYLDAIDKQSGSGKLDILIQVPYAIKTQSKMDLAEKRRTDLEGQMQDSKYGIGLVDGTEKITQLNRPAENNLLNQIQYLTEMLYGELGITKDVMNGTADEKTMLNYYNRTIEPILGAITEAMLRTFVTQTARTQGQSIIYVRDPFKLVEISSIAEIADKFTRNEILTGNEVRGLIGFRPVSDPKADELRNKNIPEVNPNPDQPTAVDSTNTPKGDTQNGRT